MKLYKLLLTKNECYLAGKEFVPAGIMWHSTGAPNKKLSRYVGPDDGRLGENKYGNHWNTAKPGGRKVCAHAFIGLLADGTVATYQTLPWNMRGWHAGGSGNDRYIGFEICEDNLTDKDYFNAVYKEAVELSAYLCKMYKLDPMKSGVIICHSEGYKMGVASNHSDVMHWFKKFGKTMDDVRKDTAAALAELNAPVKTDTLYRVQVGAYKGKSGAEALMKKLVAAGFDVYLVKVDNLYKVQTGAFSKRSNAEALSKKLAKAGFTSFITTKTGKVATTKVKTIDIGSKVKVNKGAKSYTGQKIASFVYKGVYVVDDIDGSRVLLDEDGICTAFNIKDLTLA